jgi:S1-C subfamily serine protease
VLLGLPATTALLFLLLAVGALPEAPPTWRPGPTPAEAGDQRLEDIQELIETAKRRVYPALVFVKPVQEDLSEGEARRVEVLGSGVIFHPDGFVVTNHHVAEKAREIRCVLGDRRQVDAEVVGLDRATDLAVLKLDLPEGETVPFAAFGKSDALEEGQFVLALGSPYGFERSISLGIISNARRHLAGDEHPYNNWIQTDAAINPGNSGGPLVNTRGEVIGINTLGIRQADNLGFAIPVRTVERVVERLMKDGRVHRSRHGLTLRALVDYIQNTIFEGEDGVIVDDVAPASAAEEAGLRKGDRILIIGGRPVRGKYLEDLPEIRWILADLPPGETVPVVFRRGGEEHSTDLVLEEDIATDDKGLECDRWDATFQRITAEETPALHFWRPGGIYVLGVSLPGNAAESGLRPEDVVLEVDGETVNGLAGLQGIYERILAEDRAQKRVLFLVLRNGFREYISLDYGPDYDRED